MIEPNAILGIVLAGGQSRRMHGPDKALLRLGNQPLVTRAIAKLAQQVPSVALNTNRAPQDFEPIVTVPIFADTISGFMGPLAGIHSAMNHAKRYHPGGSHIATVAADTPFFPSDLVSKLALAITSDAPIALASSGNNRHPVFGLWPLSLAGNLAQWLAESDTMKVMAWVKMQGYVEVDFAIEKSGDPFFNINTPDDLAQAERMLSERAA